MKPLLFASVPSYGVVYLAAFLAAIACHAALARRATPKVGFWKHVDIGFQVAIAGEIGSRLAFLVVEWERFAEGTIGLRQFLVGGRVVLAGVAAGTLAAAYLFRKHRLPVAETLDAAGVGVALGMAIGRIGCLLAGCCFGAPTDLAWGITFRDPIAHRMNGVPLGVPLHPTQPVLIAIGFALFILLARKFGRRDWAGQVCAWFLSFQGLARIVVEVLRDDPRGDWIGVSTSQWIGAALFTVGVAWIVIGRRLRLAVTPPSTAPSPGWLYVATECLVPVFRHYWRFDVSGTDDLPRTGPVIFVANHTSFLDPWFLGAVLPRRIRFLINRDWHERSRLWRAAFDAYGTIPVVPGEPKSTVRGVVDALRDGHAVTVFPEGGISDDGKPRRFHTGVAYMAAVSGAPVIPVGLRGPFDSLPRGRKWPARGEIRVRVGEPSRFPGSPTPAPERSSIGAFVSRLEREVLELSSTPRRRRPRSAPRPRVFAG